MNRLLSYLPAGEGGSSTVDTGTTTVDGSKQNPFGTVKLPDSLSLKYGDNPSGAIGTIIQYVIWILIAGAGIYALINFILAGYAFLSAGDDPKKVAGAWAKIWQTALGLLVAAGAFVLAAIFGELIFGQWDFIINPVIPTI